MLGNQQSNSDNATYIGKNTEINSQMNLNLKLQCMLVRLCSIVNVN